MTLWAPRPPGPAPSRLHQVLATACQLNGNGDSGHPLWGSWTSQRLVWAWMVSRLEPRSEATRQGIHRTEKQPATADKGYLSSSTSPHSWITGSSLSSPVWESVWTLSESSSVIAVPKRPLPVPSVPRSAGRQQPRVAQAATQWSVAWATGRRQRGGAAEGPAQCSSACHRADLSQVPGLLSHLSAFSFFLSFYFLTIAFKLTVILAATLAQHFLCFWPCVKAQFMKILASTL